jgi:Ribbon-helix-helix protein, copG family
VTLDGQRFLVNVALEKATDSLAIDADLQRVTIQHTGETMDTTLTVRLGRAQDEQLTARAKVTGQTRSELVRDLIDRGLEERPLGRRIGHLKGRLDVPPPKAGWPRRIKGRNWR